MTRLLLLALLLLPAPALGYSIVWGPALSIEGQAEAWVSESQGFPAAYDAQAYGGASPDFVRAEAWGFGDAVATSGATLNSLQVTGQGYAPEVLGGATGQAFATVQRLFRVVGGAGTVDVSITGEHYRTSQVTVGFPWMEWAFGVEGVSSIGETYYWGEEGGDFTWSDQLVYGQTYVASARVWVSQSDRPEASMSLWIDAPSEAQPIPEPATWVLLGLGLVPLLRRRRCS